MNLGVAGIVPSYEEWHFPSATFMVPRIDWDDKIHRYIRDPDKYLIKVS
jgi:hypothetical protein